MRWTTMCWLVLLSASSAAGRSRAVDRPVIAVFDVEDEGVGLQPEVLRKMTNYLAVLLAERGYQVIPRSQIQTRLQQQKQESYQGCYDQRCQIELGRELAAQKSLSSQIIAIAGLCRVTASVFDLKTAATARAATAKADCREQALLTAVENIADKLSLNSVGEPPEPTGGAGTEAEEAAAAVPESRAAVVVATTAPSSPESLAPASAPSLPVEPAAVEPTVMNQAQPVQVATAAAKPANVWAHAAFWSGVAAVGFGGAAMALSMQAGGDYQDGDVDARERSEAWEGAMWAGFGAGAALVATGIGLWLSEPDVKEPISSGPNITLLSDGQGVNLIWSGSW